MLKTVLNALKGIKHGSKGFTLIELLVVIGILGILAAALVATIDPFEQLKKGNDSNVENTQIEFINAVIRYYTINNAFPWDGTNAQGADCVPIAGASQLETDLGSITSSGGVVTQISDPFQLGSFVGTCLSELVTSGELKPAFESATGILDEIWVAEANNSMITCYNPDSKSKSNSAAAKWLSDDPDNVAILTDDTGNGTCIGDGGSNEDCFVCTQG